MPNGIGPKGPTSIDPNLFTEVPEEQSGEQVKDVGIQGGVEVNPDQKSENVDTPSIFPDKAPVIQKERGSIIGDLALEGQLRELHIDFEDPMVHADTYAAAQHKPPAHAAELFSDVTKSKGFDQSMVPKSDKELTAIYEKAAKEIKSSMADVKKLMEAGRYAEAKQKLDDLMKKDFSAKTSTGGVSLTGEGVMLMMNGVGTEGVNTINTLKKQLDFVTDMQKAGILADFPPTEKQMDGYFSTFKQPAQPEEAKKAFSKYVDNFYVHIAESSGDIKADVKYSKDAKLYGFDHKVYTNVADANKAYDDAVKAGKDPSKLSITDIQTSAADTWNDVASKDKAKTGQFAGKATIDCEGYAYLADKLLGDAGFHVTGYVSSERFDANDAHVMTLLTDPSGKPVVVSNNHIYDESNVKLSGKDKDKDSDTHALLDAGWQYGAGVNRNPKAYYIGQTSSESQANMTTQVKGREMP